jgi:hypothetical protein
MLEKKRISKVFIFSNNNQAIRIGNTTNFAVFGMSFII